jgi:hypothetical protein
MTDPSRKPPVILVAFPAMLKGPKVETTELAYDTAVDLSVRALEDAGERGADPAADITEPLHDALARLAALSHAGAIGRIA